MFEYLLKKRSNTGTTESFTLKVLYQNISLFSVLLINSSIIYTAVTEKISVPAIIAIYFAQTVLIIFFALLRLFFMSPKAHRLYITGILLFFYGIFILYFWMSIPAVDPNDYPAILCGSAVFFTTYIFSFFYNKKLGLDEEYKYFKNINLRITLIFFIVWLFSNIQNASIFILLTKLLIDIFSHNKKYP